MATTYAPQTTSGTTTTFLPRITPFTGPAICSDWSHNLATYNSELSSTYLYAWDPLYGLYINESVTCQPAEATTWAMGLSSRTSLSSASSDLGDSVTILAPFSCPGNWTAAWSSTENPSTSATVCCPSGYDVSIGYYLDNNFGTAQPDVACLYTLGPGYQYEYALLVTETGSKSGTVWTTHTSGISSSNVLLTGYSLSGWNMEVSATSTDASQNKSSSDLNSGAKAGIGVGVTLGVVLAVMIAALLYFRRRRKQKSASTSIPELQGHNGGTALYEAAGQPCHELHGPIGRPELHEAAGQPRHELHGPIDRPELHESRNLSPQELDG